MAHKHPLQNLLEKSHLEFRSYSGFRETCLGVDCKLGELLQAAACVERDDWAPVHIALGAVRSESMGKGTIYYFPGVTFTE